ncbi:MAG: hypothetical protein M3N33_09475 [Actinomycetota bacterium]|nr:hypothetical protein [Actinomycetota bacterium]
MVALRNVDELEVHGERAHDPVKVFLFQAVDQVAEPPLEPGLVVEAQPLAQQPYFFFGVEEAPALLLDQDLPEHPPEQVDVPPQRLVLGRETDPGGEVRVPDPRRLLCPPTDTHSR